MQNALRPQYARSAFLRSASYLRSPRLRLPQARMTGMGSMPTRDPVADLQMGLSSRMISLTLPPKPWLRYFLAALCLAACTEIVRAGETSDWLDDMPAVPVVVDVVRQYTDGQIRQNPQLAANPDYFPMQLIGTFVLLRWVMEFQVETLGALPPSRAKRMREIALEYMQTEYAIGLGTTQRNGYVRQLCHRDGPNRAFFKTFPSADECHRYVTQQIVSNIYASFVYRNAVFPLLFCGHAKVYLDLMQANILTLPAPERSPAVTGVMADRVTPLGSGVCASYGGDANRNGLCDDWEKPTATNAAERSRCGPVILRSVHTLDEHRLRVELEATNLRAGETLSFRVARDEKAEGTGAQELERADGIVGPPSGSNSTLEAIVTVKASLKTDATRPYLFMETVSRPSQASVHCEQPLLQWQQRQMERVPLNGLHGPYPDLDRAVLATRRLALAMTASNEAGFLILRDMRLEKRHYYSTPPVPAAPPSTGGSAFVLIGDYGASLRNAFTESCDELSSFAVATFAHTHPKQGVLITRDRFLFALPINDNFSGLRKVVWVNSGIN